LRDRFGKGDAVRVGMVGLGRMGANMTTRLLRDGHSVVAYDISEEARRAAEGRGAVPAGTLQELVEGLDPPRAVWVMVPAGKVTNSTISELAELCEAGDIVVDGGNSRYTDSIQHARFLKDKGIAFVDAGTSGGIWGLEEGYCLMVGADQDAFVRLEPIFRTLAPPDGYALVGGPGAGHFVKMVHNGVEYALMQAYGEGFEILEHSEFDLDLPAIAEVWRHGSVVRSWLLDLTAEALRKDPKLAAFGDWVEDSGEGRWTVQTAIDNAVPAPTIALSLFARFASRQDQSFSGKLLAALRQEFGGHAARGPGDGG
jgi:6-phosphogluconate dehydrogenase